MIFALALSLSLAQTPTAAPQAALALMPEPERKAFVEKLSKEELEKVLQSTLQIFQMKYWRIYSRILT